VIQDCSPNITSKVQS